MGAGHDRVRSGTGKGHFLEALGHHAIDQGLKVTWLTLEALGALVRRHRVDDSVIKAITRLLRVDLIVVDGIGLLPVGTDAAEAFYRLIDAAYERRALAISSNVHPAGFDELMPTTLATAGVDRLLHHAHVILTQGDSYRLREATTGRGDAPHLTPAGENWWPPTGRSGGHQRVGLMTARGEISLAIDSGPTIPATMITR